MAEEYEAELAESRTQLQKLREKMVQRIIQRTTNRLDGRAPDLRVRVDQQHLAIDESKLSYEQLVRMLIACLLEPTTLLPVDVDTLHSRILRGPAGEKYGRLLSSLGLQGPHGVVARLCAVHRVLEALSLELGPQGQARRMLLVTQLDRMAASRFAGVEDPMARVHLQQMQQQLMGSTGAAGAAGVGAAGPGGMGGPASAMGMPPGFMLPPGAGGGQGGPAGAGPGGAGGMMAPPGGMGPMGRQGPAGGMPSIMGPGGGQGPGMGMGGGGPAGGMPSLMPPITGPSGRPDQQGGMGGMQGMGGGMQGMGGGMGGGMQGMGGGMGGGEGGSGGPGGGMGIGSMGVGLEGVGMKRGRPDEAGGAGGGGGGGSGGGAMDLDALLSRKTMRDRLALGKAEDAAASELVAVLAKPSAKEAAALEQFRTAGGGTAIQEHCPALTKEECRRANNSMTACHRVHFRKLIFPHTDVSLGNCSYLNTCRNIRNCKYVHYEVDDEAEAGPGSMAVAAQGGAAARAGKPQLPVPKYLEALPQPQWVRCDVRKLDMKCLGKFGVIMADPPWQIHQDLPYGTMEDDEMRALDIGCLQDDGVIFLWVTGRAMELGRECLKLWGYDRVDELIWVKTNQLNRLIRTGRTGHWINHSKEHCLVGVKGKPQLNRYVDCDVVVAEVRETSRKPDEMYSLLERLSPGTRKLEIFARQHNLKPGWVGLGNQLDAVQVLEPDMRARFEARYGPQWKDHIPV